MKIIHLADEFFHVLLIPYFRKIFNPEIEELCKSKFHRSFSEGPTINY